jgi:phosphoserine phosphatase
MRQGTYPSLIFFDLEGTLLQKNYQFDNGKVAPSAWTVLAASMGKECLEEEERTKERWINNKYPGYVEWMRDTIRIHKKFGLRQDLFDRVMRSVALMPGAREAFEQFRAKGAITVVISGGFKALADRVQRELKIDHALAACEYFFHQESGEIEHFNLLPSDEKGKVQFMRLIALEHGIKEKNCVFVGDGKNDVPLAKEVGFSIAFNAQDELQNVATVTINQGQGAEDLREVARVIEEQFCVK